MTQPNWPISAPPLTDGEVSLHGWDHKDTEVVDTAGQKSEIPGWTMVPSPYDPEHAADFVGERSLTRWRERSAHHLRSRQRLMICHLGACGLVQVYLFNLVVHVGYWVAP